MQIENPARSSQYYFQTTTMMGIASLCLTNAVLSATAQEEEEPMMSVEKVPGCTRQYVESRRSGRPDQNTH